MQKLFTPLSEHSSAKRTQKQPKRISTAIGLRSVINSKSASRNREIPRKSGSRKGTSYVPYPQRERIKLKYIQGENISAISREEGRHWETVSKIVKEADVLEYVKDLRARFYGALEEVLYAAIECAKNAKDGWLAYQMCIDGGIIPSESERNRPAPVTPESEQSMVKRIATRMVEGAIERHKWFELPFPEADEIEAELKDEEKSGAGPLSRSSARHRLPKG